MSAAQVEVDAALRGAFAPDYADAFRVPAVPGVPARRWARAALASGPPATQRLFGGLVWHGLLGFELDGDFVGWTVTKDTPEELVIDADGTRMAGRIVFQAGADAVTWTTMLRFHRPSGARIWKVAGAVHRALAGSLLEKAYRRRS